MNGEMQHEGLSHSVRLRRGKRGFGFTLAGERPSELVAVLPGGPADVMGLRPGDRLLTVGGVRVWDASHADVVRLVGQESKELTFTVEPVDSKWSRQQISDRTINAACHSRRTGSLSSCDQEVADTLLPSDSASDSSSGLGWVDTVEAEVEGDTPNELNGQFDPYILEFCMLVGYLGSVELPTGPQTLQALDLSRVQSCIERMRNKHRLHAMVLMRSSHNCIQLLDEAGEILASYAAETLALAVPYHEDHQLFALLTVQGPEHIQISMSSEFHASCHVFHIDPSLSAHGNHHAIATQFGFECTPDRDTNGCLEFPETCVSLLSLATALYRDMGPMVGSLREKAMAEDAGIVKSPLDSSLSSNESFKENGLLDSDQQPCRYYGKTGEWQKFLKLPNTTCQPQPTCRRKTDPQHTEIGKSMYVQRKHLSMPTPDLPPPMRALEMNKYNIQAEMNQPPSNKKCPKRFFRRLSVTSRDMSEKVVMKSDRKKSTKTSRRTSFRRLLGKGNPKHGFTYSVDGLDVTAASDGELSDMELRPSSSMKSLQSNSSLPCKPGGRCYQGRVASWAISFQRLLQDPLGLQYFTDFLKKEFSEENIQFWLSCEHFKDIPISEEKRRRKAAEEIYEMFLSARATRPINIEGALKVGHQQLADPHPDMFSEQQQQIFNLMKFDSYTRFLKSELYQRCLLAEVGGQGLPPLTSRRSSEPCVGWDFDIGKQAESGHQTMACCQLVLPEGDCVTLKVRRGLLLQDVVKPLCEQRGLPLCNVDAYVRGTDKPLSMQRDSWSLAGQELWLERKTFFRLDLIPIRRSISIKAKATKAVTEVLRPIMTKYDMDLDYLSVKLAGGRLPLDLGIAVSNLDGKRVIVDRTRKSLPDGRPLDYSAELLSSKPRRQTQELLEKEMAELHADKEVAADLKGAKDKTLTGRKSCREGSSKSNWTPRMLEGMLQRKKCGKVKTKLDTNEELFEILIKAQARRVNDQRGLLRKEDLILPDFLKPKYPAAGMSKFEINQEQKQALMKESEPRLFCQTVQHTELASGHKVIVEDFGDGLIPSRDEAEMYFASSLGTLSQDFAGLTRLRTDGKARPVSEPLYIDGHAALQEMPPWSRDTSENVEEEEEQEEAELTLLAEGDSTSPNATILAQSPMAERFDKLPCESSPIQPLMQRCKNIPSGGGSATNESRERDSEQRRNVNGPPGEIGIGEDGSRSGDGMGFVRRISGCQGRTCTGVYQQPEIPHIMQTKEEEASKKVKTKATFV
uniref:regulator of G-protein signaling 12-like n=1 Tax=Myxine glutinosa TaxID=7769 RepID=UPI00358F920B